MEAREARIMGLLDTLYESSINPEAINGFVRDLSELTGSAMGGIYRSEASADRGEFLGSYGASSEELHAFERDGQSYQQYCSLVAPRPTPGHIAYTQDLPPDGQQRLTQFYHTLLKLPRPKQANCLFIEHDDQHSLTGAFFREHSQRNYDDNQKAIFRQVMPHLQRSFRLQSRTDNLRIDQHQVWEMLTLMPYGVVVFSNRQRVMYVNHAAERMAFANDGLALNTTHLSARLCTENQRLRHLLKRCIESTGDPESPLWGGDLQVTRPSGKRAYSVMINPISPCGKSENVYPAAIVILQDHEECLQAPISRMRELYDLTPAESRVAHQIMLGRSLDVCASNLGHTVTTSRNLLKRVFAKTNTGRQNELVSLLLRSPLNLIQRFHR